jgi:hypothetical protein
MSQMPKKDYQAMRRARKPPETKGRPATPPRPQTTAIKLTGCSDVDLHGNYAETDIFLDAEDSAGVTVEENTHRPPKPG